MKLITEEFEKLFKDYLSLLSCNRTTVITGLIDILTFESRRERDYWKTDRENDIKKEFNQDLLPKIRP